MADLFGRNQQLIWALVLAVALFFPVRQLIWVLSVRRAERRDGREDEARRTALRRRATITAGLLSFVFAFFYAGAVLRGGQ